MKRLSIPLVILCFSIIQLAAAGQTGTAVWIEGESTVGAARTRMLEEALLFRLRFAQGVRQPTRIIRAKFRASALMMARQAGYRVLAILDAANAQARLVSLRDNVVTAQSRPAEKNGLTMVENLARLLEGKKDEEILIDIVWIVETGGKMHRLINDAADTVSRMGIILQNGLPVPDSHWGLMTFSSSDELTFTDLSPSSERVAELIREQKSGYGDGSIPMESIIRRLAQSVSWRAGSQRYAVLYANGQGGRAFNQLGQLESPGVRLITIPADSSSTETHRTFQALASRSGGRNILPEYLVRYRDASTTDRAFVLKDRTLLRMNHDIPERNWKRYYSGLREPTHGSRRFRAGSIDEAIEILQRSGRKGIRIREVQSSMGDAILAAINNLQPTSKRILTAHPDAVCTAMHNRRQISMPAVLSKTVRITPQAGTWLGLSIIPDYYAEDGFRIHPQSLQLFPASIPPPAQARRTWSSISKRPSHVKNDALFTPGRVYLRVSSVRIIPIRKKPYVLEE